MDFRSHSSPYTCYPAPLSSQLCQVAHNRVTTTQLYPMKGEEDVAVQQLLERRRHEVLQVSTWQLQGIQKPREQEKCLYRLAILLCSRRESYLVGKC